MVLLLATQLFEGLKHGNFTVFDISQLQCRGNLYEWKLCTQMNMNLVISLPHILSPRKLNVCTKKINST